MHIASHEQNIKILVRTFHWTGVEVKLDQHDALSKAEIDEREYA